MFYNFTLRRKEIIRLIQEEPESRREWMLDRFGFAGRYNSKIKNYKFWQDGNHSVELFNSDFIKQKLNYIHNNPVEEMFVSEAHEYLYSSARNYADINGLLDVILI